MRESGRGGRRATGRRLLRTKADTRLIVERLKKEYPVSECSLAYDDAWQLLVSVRLSAQCTDARVNIVTKDLFAKYPTLEALAAAGPDAIEAIIKPCGLGKSKARDLAGMANMLLREYGGKVPQAMEDLLRLPGVGRKSANLIRGDIFHLPAVVADTHCIRMANRIGFVTDTTDPVQVERALVKVLPPEESNDFCHRCVMHGRVVCTARKALCEVCCLQDVCRTGKKPSNRKHWRNWYETHFIACFVPDFKPGFAGRVRRRAAARRPDAGKRDGRRGADRGAAERRGL